MTEWARGQTLDDYLAITISAIIFVSCLFILAVTIGVVLRLVNYYRKYKQKTIVLEVTPPAFQDKRPDSTSQFLSVIHGLFKVRSVSDYLLRYTPSFSLEILSTKKQGIRYLIHVEEKYKEVILQTIQAYLTDAQVKVLKDYPDSNGYLSIGVYRQLQHFAIPIDSNRSLDSHDPVSYLTNAMTKLDNNELMSLKLVITPTALAEAHRIDTKIRNGYWSGSSLNKFFSTKNLFGILWRIFKLPFQLAWFIIYSFFNHDIPPSAKSSGRQSYAKPPPAEQELIDQMHNKLSQDLFYVDIRSCIITKDKKRVKDRNRALVNSLATYSTSYRQSLRPVGNWMPTRKLLTRVRSFMFFNGLPALLHKNSNVFSSEEIGTIFHFPHSRSARTENIVKSLSKTLPAPISLKGDNTLDILIGENHHQGTVTPIGLTQSERERHIYILGGTGNGKTTMILYQIVQDIRSGKGIAVVDPHGDLAESILSFIPERRIKDVIYMNPDDLAHPIGLNLLELTPGLTGNDLLREKDIVTEATVSVLRKIFSEDDTGGHRIEYILRNSIQTALTLEDPTLFTIFKLLNDAKFRRKVTSELEDENLRDFWKNELGKAGEFQRVKMAAGITSKIGRFLFSASARAVLEQPKSTINFDEILADGKILICNFSKGLIGDDTSALFGTTVLAKLQTASLRRARIKSDSRTPFYLYVDEFQNFATMSFVQMLSEARKYKLFLTMAEQSTSQQDQQRLVDIILANVGTVVCFRSGSPVDERLVLPLFSPYVEQGEIANLPSYNFYVRISAVHSQEPMSGVTVLLEEPSNEQVSLQVIDSSRKLYAKKIDNSKEEINKKSSMIENTKGKALKKKAKIKNGFDELDDAPHTK